MYRKRSKNIYIMKEHFHWPSRIQALSKTPIKITEAVKHWEMHTYTHLHFVVSNEIMLLRILRLSSRWTNSLIRKKKVDQESESDRIVTRNGIGSDREVTKDSHP